MLTDVIAEEEFEIKEEELWYDHRDLENGKAAYISIFSNSLHYISILCSITIIIKNNAGIQMASYRHFYFY